MGSTTKQLLEAAILEASVDRVLRGEAVLRRLSHVEALISMVVWLMRGGTSSNAQNQARGLVLATTEGMQLFNALAEIERAARWTCVQLT